MAKRRITTEQDWLTSEDIDAMLRRARFRSSPRKSRLFAVACCRCAWACFVDQRSRQAIEIAERYADGHATQEELAGAAQAARAALKEIYQMVGFAGSALEDAAAAVASDRAGAAATACCKAGTPRILDRRQQPGDWENPQLTPSPCALTQRSKHGALLSDKWQVTLLEQAVPTGAELPVQVALLRCIFGNPFRPVSSVSSTVLSWHEGTIVKLAQAIYTEKAFEQLPILADALEDAGCTEAELLAHCRSSGPHARGCWPVDLLLGKAEATYVGGNAIREILT